MFRVCFCFFAVFVDLCSQQLESTHNFTQKKEIQKAVRQVYSEISKNLKAQVSSGKTASLLFLLLSLVRFVAR